MLSEPGQPSIAEAPDMLRCELTKHQEGMGPTRYVLELEIMKQPAAGKSQTQVVIQTTEGDKSRLTIPVEVIALE
jgi:hypothetical protein